MAYQKPNRQHKMSQDEKSEGGPVGKKGGFPGSRKGSACTHRTKTPTYEKLSKNKKAN